jgi:FLVCR family MFS transporter
MLLVGIIAVPISYSILNFSGLRTTIVWSGSGVLAVGALIRCISMDGSIQQWASLLCGAMNGWSSIMIECTLTVMSVKWFPAGERTTATGMVIATQMAGLIPPALLFPRIVQEPSANQTNCTESKELTETIRTEVSYILYAEAALACVVFFAMVLHFPDAPPSPPSPSATAQRFNIKEGLSNIFTSPKNILTGKLLLFLSSFKLLILACF